MANPLQLTLPTGEKIDATAMAFDTTEELWNLYVLEDGTAIRVKIVVTGIYRLEGQSDPLGQPSYFIESTNVMSVRSQQP